MFQARWIRLLLLLCAGILLMPAAGCQLALLAGGIGQNIERMKKIEVLAEYEGLQGQSIAVLVHQDMWMMYEFPSAGPNITYNLSNRIAANVQNARVIDPAEVLKWQYHTPAWENLPYGEMAEELGVERVIVVDIYEFRLHPHGNSWTWDGVCAANIGVVEQGGFEPDQFVETYHVVVRFPNIEGLGRESATRNQIETGVLTKFVRDAAWLFYDHIEDKYPDEA